MRTITAKDLQAKIDAQEDFVLLNVLSAEDFEKAHIPGSLNVPQKRDSFLQDVENLVKDKNRTVVVYCASRACTASSEAVTKLEQAGFRNVLHFEDGMAGWRTAGFQVAEPAHTR